PTDKKAASGCPGCGFFRNGAVRLFPGPRLWASLLRQCREPLAKTLEIDRNADAFLGRLEDDEGRRLAGGERVDQRLFQDDLRVAAVLEATHEIGAANILAVDIEAEAVGQEHAERRQDAQDLRLVVGGAQ